MTDPAARESGVAGGEASLIVRLRKHVHDRGGASLENGAWQMMLDAADVLETYCDEIQRRNFCAVMSGPDAQSKAAIWKGMAEDFAKQLDAAEKEIARLTAALSTAEGSGAVAWRDIASAPKDGTRILGCPVWSTQPVGEIHWRDMKRIAGRWETGIGPCGYEPTHWMPLPASPSPSASEGE